MPERPAMRHEGSADTSATASARPADGDKLTLRRVGRTLYGFNQRLIAPNLRHSQVIYAEMLPRFVSSSTAWLDLGCGHRILRGYQFDLEKELVATSERVVGIDLDLDALRRHRTIRDRTYGDLVRLPFADESFHLVTANMVVEHLDDPPRVLQEVKRVLRPGGAFLFHTPNTRGYKVILSRLVPGWLKPKLVYFIEGRREEDVFPTTYRMNTPERITRVARETGLEVERIRLLTSSGHHALALVPPVSWLQLIWIRLLLTRPLRPLRTNIIAVLRKPGTHRVS